MHDRVLLVDFENTQKVDLAQIPAGVRVMVFFGATQKSVTRDYHKQALKLGERCVEIDIHGQGKNALDFHIAFYLGEFLTKTPSAESVILSKDKGFDPLVEHLRGRNFNVRRVAAQAEAFSTQAAGPAGQSPFERALGLLKKMEKRARPRKRKGLLAHLGNAFKSTPASEVEKLVDQLFADGHVSEANGALVYKI